MQFWLMKSEPSTYGIDTLLSKPNQTDFWDGVRNYQARNFLRDQIKKGDLAFFYHSNCDTPGIVGVMEVVESSTPDKTAFDPDSKYYDPKSTAAHPRWFRVKVKGIRKMTETIPLSQLKSHPGLKNMALCRPGNRLSVMPVSQDEWKVIEKLEKSIEKSIKESR